MKPSHPLVEQRRLLPVLVLLEPRYGVHLIVADSAELEDRRRRSDCDSERGLVAAESFG